MARGDVIWWPQAPQDAALAPDLGVMAVLQHELQHVLDYREGRLTAAGYLLNPRNWSYAWSLDGASDWAGLGAEQRAAVAEHFWLVERGRSSCPDPEALARLIPWARLPAAPPRPVA